MQSDIKRKGIFGPNSIVAIVAYIISMFILGTVFIYLFAYVYSIEYDGKIVFNDLIRFIADGKISGIPEIYKDLYVNASLKIQSYANFLSYFLGIVFAVIYLRDILKSSLITLNKYKIQYLLMFVSAIAFVGVTYLIDLFISSHVQNSVNQSTIETLIKGDYRIPMIIATVIFAPILEELIYRGAIFKLTKNHKVAGYIISIILFTFPHMLSTPFDNPFIWLFQSVPYIASALLLCLIYDLFKGNIYASILAHMFNNALAIVLVLFV